MESTRHKDWSRFNKEMIRDGVDTASIGYASEKFCYKEQRNQAVVEEECEVKERLFNTGIIILCSCAARNDSTMAKI